MDNRTMKGFQEFKDRNRKNIFGKLVDLLIRYDMGIKMLDDILRVIRNEKELELLIKRYNLEKNKFELEICFCAMAFGSGNKDEKKDFFKRWKEKRKNEIEWNKLVNLIAEVKKIIKFRDTTSQDKKDYPLSQIHFIYKSGEKIQVSNYYDMAFITRILKDSGKFITSRLHTKMNRTETLKEGANLLFQFALSETDLHNGKAKLNTKVANFIYDFMDCAELINDEKISSPPKDYIRTLLR